MAGYRSSERIFDSIMAYEKSDPDGMNGFLLLLHIGTHPDRKDKFYYRLEELIDRLSFLDYVFLKVDEFGLVQDVCGAPNFESAGTAVEGQAFFLLMEAAVQDYDVQEREAKLSFAEAGKTLFP